MTSGNQKALFVGLLLVFCLSVNREVSNSMEYSSRGKMKTHSSLNIFESGKREKERVDIGTCSTYPVSCSLPSDSLYTCVCVFVYLLPPLQASSFKK